LGLGLALGGPFLSEGLVQARTAANQGLFEIRPRDEAPGLREESQIYKTVRVVSTVESFLKD
jgi:hypothetical protein